MPAKGWQGSGIRKAGLWSALLIFLSLLSTPAAASDRPFASAAKTFGDLVDYDMKLIETEGVPLANSQPADTVCLIAAVRLSHSAPAQPPRRDRTRPLYAQFGGDWRPTPISARGPQGKDILSICGAYLRVDGFDDRLRNALEAPGSYYIRDFTGSLLQVYAPERQIAASIRLAQRKRGQ